MEVVVAFDFEDAAFSMADGRAVAAAWRSEFSDGLGLGSGEEICENKVAVVVIIATTYYADDAEEQDEIKRDLNM